jgi:hypothetical protein
LKRRNYLEIKNYSSYNTSDLKKLAKLVLEHEGVWPPPERGFYSLVFKNGRTNYSRGEARFHQPYITMWMPSRKSLNGNGKLSENQIKTFIQVFMHEIGHNRGLKHREMMKWWKLDTDWYDGSLEVNLQ